VSIGDNELFDRVCEITVNTLKVTDLRMAFRVEKTLKPIPNTCEIQIWNLTADQRAELEQMGGGGKVAKKSKLISHSAQLSTKGIPVKIEAGYKSSGTSQLYLGELRFAESQRDGPDWVTHLSSGDGLKAHKLARVTQSFGPRTSVDTALRAIVRALGVDEGNVSTTVAKLRLSGAAKLFTQGAVISGSAAQQMTDWARSADLEWSIQDGAIQFLDRGKALETKALVISSDTGMIGSPSVDSEGMLTVQTLMIPDVRPGTLLVMKADQVQGNYRAEKVTWEGDTRGDPWYVTFEAKGF
jgi:hypothetical protein